MKKKIFRAGIIGLLILIGFVFIGCDDPNTGIVYDGYITVNGSATGMWSLTLHSGTINTFTQYTESLSLAVVSPYYLKAGNKYGLLKMPSVTFNKNGTYEVVYISGTGYKVQHNVKFTNGEATVNVDTMIELE